MDGDDDLVMDAYVKSKLGIGLPPTRDHAGLIDKRSLTEDTDRIVSVSSSIFEFDGSIDDRIIEEKLHLAGRGLEEMMENIDSLKERLKRLK